MRQREPSSLSHFFGKQKEPSPVFESNKKNRPRCLMFDVELHHISGIYLVDSGLSPFKVVIQSSIILIPFTISSFETDPKLRRI